LAKWVVNTCRVFLEPARMMSQTDKMANTRTSIVPRIAPSCVPRDARRSPLRVTKAASAIVTMTQTAVGFHPRLALSWLATNSARSRKMPATSARRHSA
jgi:hypothetical protein